MSYFIVSYSRAGSDIQIDRISDQAHNKKSFLDPHNKFNFFFKIYAKYEGVGVDTDLINRSSRLFLDTSIYDHK